MRYSAAEKHEIINLVEKSALPVRRTLAQLDIPKSTFYGWYDRFVQGGIEALEDGTPAPKIVIGGRDAASVKADMANSWRLGSLVGNGEKVA